MRCLQVNEVNRINIETERWKGSVFAFGSWQLAVGSWLIAVGSWLLADRYFCYYYFYNDYKYNDYFYNYHFCNDLIKGSS